MRSEFPNVICHVRHYDSACLFAGLQSIFQPVHVQRIQDKEAPDRKYTRLVQCSRDNIFSSQAISAAFAAEKLMRSIFAYIDDDLRGPAIF